jgi:hypothetical protein
MRLYLISFTIVILGFVCLHCFPDDNTGFYYYNNLFPNTSRFSIAISPGDEGSTNPDFSWSVRDEHFIALWIFDAPIRVDFYERVILNKKDAIWMWNTELPTGREGNVRYSDGVQVVNGIPQETGSAVDLPLGTYYFGGWSQDESMDLVRSSNKLIYTKIE